jgi:hypothetical protein
MSFFRASTGFFAVLFFAALPLAAQNHYYTTQFPATENPICEAGSSGCVWVNGAKTGIDWGNIQTTPKLAFGVSLPSQYGDPTAVLQQGTWTADQTAQATIYVGTTPPNCCHEAELRLRSTIAAHRITGYEINCSVVPSSQYIQIVRWNGAVADFTYVNTGNGYCANGDVLKATIVGSTITVYKNGTQVLQGTDSTFTSGAPGLAFYDQTDFNWSNFGFSKFTAWDSAYNGQQPSPPTNLTGTPVQK